jgi:hypothetical protein
MKVVRILFVLIVSCTGDAAQPPSAAVVGAKQAAPAPVAPSPSAAGLACDPKDPPGDRTNPTGRFMCQLALDGRVQPAFPCDAIARTEGATHYAQFRLVDGKLRCYAEGSITSAGKFEDGYVSCYDATDKRTVLESIQGPVVAIPGGYRVEGLGNDFAARRQVPVVFVFCRKPWPAGFVSDFDRP